MEEHIASWVRQLGFQPAPGDAALTRSNLAKLVKGPHRQTWEFLMMRSKALAEANSAKQRLAAAKQGGLSSTQELALAKERALLDKKIQQQLEHNRKQANMVEVHTAHVQNRVAEALQEEGLVEQLTQDMNHLEMQGRTLQAYQSRVARLLPELELYRTKFQQLARLANSRCSAMQGPSIGQGREQAGSSSADKTLAAIRALSMELTQALHARAYAWMSGEEARGLEGLSSASSLAQQPMIEMPSEGDLQTRIQALSSYAPTDLVRALTQVMHHAMDELAAQIRGLDTGHGGGASIGSYANMHPLELLMQRQRAHLARAVEIEGILLAVRDAEAALEALKPGAQPVLAWPYNQLRLQEARALGELSVLQPEINRLAQERAALEHVQAALADQHKSYEAGELRQRQLNNLLGKLIGENGQLTHRWIEETTSYKVWANRYLPDAALSAGKACDEAQDLVAGETAAAASMPYAALLPALISVVASRVQRRRATTGPSDSQQQHSQGPSTSGLQDASGSHLPSGLFRYAIALPSAANAASGPGSDRRGMRSPGGPRLGQGAAASTGSTPEAPLASVLKASTGLDTLAALRCPAQLACTVGGQQQVLQQLLAWQAQARPQLSQLASKQQAQDAEWQALKQQLDAMRAGDVNQKLAAVQRYMATTKGMQEYEESAVRRALYDYKNLPAVHLLPDVQYAGLSAGEWLSAIQALHSSIREAEAMR